MQHIDTNLHQLLGTLGLTYNEAEVYLYLLRSGEADGTGIFTDLKMDKSSCYRALNSLLDAGLVTSTGKERNRSFSTASTKKLDELIKTEETRIQQAKQAFANIKTTLDAYVGSRYQHKRIQIISDSEGYNRYFEMRLKCQSKLIRDMSGRVNAAVFFDDYDKAMADYIERRAKAGIFLRQLSHPDQMDNIWDKSSKKFNKEVRLLPKDFSTEAVFAAWDDKSAFFSKDAGKLIGVVIEDPLITNVLISMFDFIWDRSK